jgi:hypothetical protein
VDFWTAPQGASEFERLSKTLEGTELSAEEQQSMDELQQYLVQGEGSWVLGDEFLAFIGLWSIWSALSLQKVDSFQIFIQGNIIRNKGYNNECE